MVDRADMDENYTYIVRCADGTLYTGWTNDLKKRIKAHNAGKGAKYTKTRRPVELVYFELSIYRFFRFGNIRTFPNLGIASAFS